jgi:hypothetical protein
VARDGLRVTPVSAPTDDEIDKVSTAVARRFARVLSRHGFVHDAADGHGSVTALDRWYTGVEIDATGFAVVDDEGCVDDRPRWLPRVVCNDPDAFSVDAGVTVPQGDRAGRERLARYVSRPPLADAQLSETADGRIAVRMRKRRFTGDTHVVLDPLAFLRRLAWLIPQPLKNQIAFAGVLAPNSKWRAEVVPVPPPPTTHESLAARGDSPSSSSTLAIKGRSASSASWAQLVRRIYDADALECSRCGGRLTPIAVIIEPAVAQKILRHLGLPDEPARFAPARAPP